MGPRLYWINSRTPGKLAICAHPHGGDWLEGEIEGWHRERVDVVVSLLSHDEMLDMNLAREPEELKKRGIRFMSLSIPDRGVPHNQSIAADFVEAVQKELVAGHTVAIHCRQGIGRSGMIAAALLVRQGLSPSEAIERITNARGFRSPETEEQRAWLIDFSCKPTFPAEGPSRR